MKIQKEIKKEIEELRYKVLKIIGCGEPFSSWVCGDFLEEEIDEDGRSSGKCYFCDKCHKKADEIINIFKIVFLHQSKDFIEMIDKRIKSHIEDFKIHKEKMKRGELTRPKIKALYKTQIRIQELKRFKVKLEN